VKNKSYIKVRRRLFVFGTISFIIIGFSLLNIINNYHRARSLESERETLSIYFEKLLEEEQQLELEILKLEDPDYVARYARENYLYSREGEIIIVLP